MTRTSDTSPAPGRTAERRAWTAPSLRRLATSAAESGGGGAFDLAEDPS
jgi:hypothetical protein